MLGVLVVNDNSDHPDSIERFHVGGGYVLVRYQLGITGLKEAVKQTRPDLIIINTESPSRQVIEKIQELSLKEPRAIVVFSNDSNIQKIRAVTHAGASAYIVGKAGDVPLQPILDAALIRFEEYQALRKELEEVLTKLEDRKSIDRAKGMLMKKCGVDEDTAYQSIRKLAMQQGVRMGEVAKQLLQISDILANSNSDISQITH